MYKKLLGFISVIIVMIFNSSCVNPKLSTYFNDASDMTILSRVEDSISPVIQRNDILNITITSLNAEASAIFNMSGTTSINSVTNTGSNQAGSGYLVNSDGFIQIPILGSIKVAGSTSKEIKELLTETLIQKKLLIDPIVTIRHLNYEVTVLGEVTRPTVINVPSEKISLLKALGLAGDITVFGKKDNVLLIREISGKRTIRRVNLNDANFLKSPYYYLKPNDVVYVEANKNKAENVSSIRQTLPIVLSGLSIILIAMDRIIN